MTRIGIRAIGVLAPGLEGWACARDVLAARRAFEPGEVRPPPSPLLPPAERRRLNANSAWALAVASEALDAAGDVDRGRLACVFATADGDGEVLAQSLDVLASRPLALSPTLFHNSVFNAPSGYVSIAHGLTGPSTTICAGHRTLAMALAECIDQVEAEARAVLCVLVDTAYPGRLAALRAPVPSFACALLVEPAAAMATHGTLALAYDATGSTPATAGVPPAVAAFFGDDTVSAALGLLAVVARGEPASAPLDARGSSAMRYTP